MTNFECIEKHMWYISEQLSPLSLSDDDGLCWWQAKLMLNIIFTLRSNCSKNQNRQNSFDQGMKVAFDSAGTYECKRSVK